jgi:hypothetical protein
MELGNGLYRMLLDALPIPVFVVDEDVRVHDLNGVALQLCGEKKPALLRRRGGEILHCLHSKDVPEGCGRGPSCRQCVIRNSVTTCFDGQTVSRIRMKMDFLSGPQQKPAELLITTSLLSDKEKLALLIVEDITEMTTLRDIIPICMKCKKIRSDAEYWQKLERYFHDYIGVEFSHGICPACSADWYPELRPGRAQQQPDNQAKSRIF